MSHRIYRVRTATCMDCGTTQRRRIPFVGDELGEVECWSCGSTHAWMSLPKLNAAVIEADHAEELTEQRLAAMSTHPSHGRALALAISELPEEVGIEMLQAFAAILGVELTLDEDEDG